MRALGRIGRHGDGLVRHGGPLFAVGRGLGNGGMPGLGVGLALRRACNGPCLASADAFASHAPGMFPLGLHGHFACGPGRADRAVRFRMAADQRRGHFHPLSRPSRRERKRAGSAGRAQRPVRLSRLDPPCPPVLPAPAQGGRGGFRPCGPNGPGRPVRFADAVRLADAGRFVREENGRLGDGFPDGVPVPLDSLPGTQPPLAGGGCCFRQPFGSSSSFSAWGTAGRDGLPCSRRRACCCR